MKKVLILLTTALVIASAAIDRANAQTLITSNANGTAASPAELIFPADPDRQFVLQSLLVNSDSNSAVLEMQTAVGAYSAYRGNRSSTDVTQEVASTSGLVTNRWLVLQRLGTTYKALLVATNNGTNVILGSGGWGTTNSAGDSFYPLGATNRIPIGANTNWYNGPALYVGNKGRPVRLLLTPALTTNSIPAATGVYQ